MSDATSLSSLATDIQVRQHEFSERVASDIIRLFRISVVSTLIFTIALASVDAAFIARGVISPAERLITESVIMSIIGASIVQVGAAATAIVYALFKARRDQATESE